MTIPQATTCQGCNGTGESFYRSPATGEPHARAGAQLALKRRRVPAERMWRALVADRGRVHHASPNAATNAAHSHSGSWSPRPSESFRQNWHVYSSVSPCD